MKSKVLRNTTNLYYSVHLNASLFVSDVSKNKLDVHSVNLTKDEFRRWKTSDLELANIVASFVEGYVVRRTVVLVETETEEVL